MLRTIIIVIYIALSLALALPYLGIMVLLRKKDRAKADEKIQAYLSSIARGVARLAGISLEVHGKENIPKDTPCLFVGNHTSYFDIIVVLSETYGVRTGFVAKLELNKIPFLNTWMKGINCVFLKRDNIREGFKVITDTMDNIKNGISMVIFPEGTRSKDGVIQEFKGGSFKIATKTGCPIIPISIKGGCDVFEKHPPRVTPTKVVLRYGTPIYPKELSKEESRTLPEKVRQVVINMLNED